MAYRQELIQQLCSTCRALAAHSCASCGRPVCQRHNRPSGCDQCRPKKTPRDRAAERAAAEAAAEAARLRAQKIGDALVVGPPLLLLLLVALFVLIGLFMPIYAVLVS